MPINKGSYYGVMSGPNKCVVERIESPLDRDLR